MRPGKRSGAPRGDGAPGSQAVTTPAGAADSTPTERQLSLTDALAERDRAAEAAELSLYTGWRLWAQAELDKLIRSGETFSADDLRAVCGDPPDGAHVNGVGGMFLRASKAGRITFVGYKVSERAAARGRPVRCWRGAL